MMSLLKSLLPGCAATLLAAMSLVFVGAGEKRALAQEEGRAPEPDPKDPVIAEIDEGKGQIVGTWEKPQQKFIVERKLQVFDLENERAERFQGRFSKDKNGRHVLRKKRKSNSERSTLSKEEAITLALDTITEEIPELVGKIELDQVGERMREREGERYPTGYVVSFKIICGAVVVWNDFLNIGITGNEMDKVSFCYHELPKTNDAKREENATEGETILGFIAAFNKSVGKVKESIGIDQDYEVIAPLLCYVAPANARGDTCLQRFPSIDWLGMQQFEPG